MAQRGGRLERPRCPWRTPYTSASPTPATTPPTAAGRRSTICGSRAEVGGADQMVGPSHRGTARGSSPDDRPRRWYDPAHMADESCAHIAAVTTVKHPKE